jgi:hypothetical protein
MPAWQYLGEVIAKAAPVQFDAEKNSVIDLIYDADTSPTEGFCFEYKHRLKKMADLIEPNARLRVLEQYHDPTRRLWGNVSKEDVHAECAVCMEKAMNFTLHCGHRFHDRCLAQWDGDTCPLCREAYSASDVEKLISSRKLGGCLSFQVVGNNTLLIFWRPIL